ncbi:uncharacterized protein LOC131674152 [Phymastichus coffea]|uniref:uncharacterized protein LOC131667307 n=1 Tax=Phymastichus coffea TaxID=108790 RepID=UPI00273B5149|nr:uncharacterized protein LOC131667307 [Phymastichus coffea]XP_058808656.1 uncharacterized protein LOC131674152 [Phymastichus coffea]
MEMQRLRREKEELRLRREKKDLEEEIEKNRIEATERGKKIEDRTEEIRREMESVKKSGPMSQEIVDVIQPTQMKRKAGDRMKGGNMDIYVVCEDVSQRPKMIKRETLDKDLKNGNEGNDKEKREKGERRSERVKEVNMRRLIMEESRSSADALEEMGTISRDLRNILLSDANKVTKWVVDRILNQCGRYEGLIQRLLIENKRLEDHVKAYDIVEVETLSEVKETCKAMKNIVEGMDKKVQMMEGKIQQSVKGLEETIARGRSEGMIDRSGGEISLDRRGIENSQGSRRSYAVVVKGIHDDLTEREIRQRMMECIPPEKGVRIKSIRPSRSGGSLVVEIPSEAERDKILNCSDLCEAGLNAHKPKKLDPRVVISGVRKGMDDDSILGGLYTQNLKGEIGEEEFRNRVKIVKRFGRQHDETEKVVVRCPRDCRNKIVSEGRVYMGLMSYRCEIYEVVERCYKCLDFDHRVFQCKKEVVCFRCGGEGHIAVKCKGKEQCVRCKIMDRQNRRYEMVKILQLNCQRSYAVMCDLGQYAVRMGIQILLLQEPYVWRDRVRGLPGGTVVYVSERGSTAVCVIDVKLVSMSVEEYKWKDGVGVWVKGDMGELFVSSVYFRPRERMDRGMAFVEEMVRVARGKRLLIGVDANAASILWHSKGVRGGSEAGRRGEEIEDWLLRTDLLVLNVPTDTFTFSGPRGEGDIDITLFSGDERDVSFEWTVKEDWPLGDHNPIRIEMWVGNGMTEDEERGRERRELREIKRWKQQGCDWEAYRECLRGKAHDFGLDNFNILGVDEKVKKLNEWIERVNNECMRRMNSSRTKKKLTWWNEELEEIKRETRRKRRIYQRQRRRDGDLDREKWN